MGGGLVVHYTCLFLPLAVSFWSFDWVYLWESFNYSTGPLRPHYQYMVHIISIMVCVGAGTKTKCLPVLSSAALFGSFCLTSWKWCSCLSDRGYVFCRPICLLFISLSGPPSLPPSSRKGPSLSLLMRGCCYHEKVNSRECPYLNWLLLVQFW